MNLRRDTMELAVGGRTFPLDVWIEANEVPSHVEEGTLTGALDFFAQFFAGVNTRARREAEIQAEEQRLKEALDVNIPKLHEMVRAQIVQGHVGGEIELARSTSQRFRGQLRITLGWKLTEEFQDRLLLEQALQEIESARQELEEAIQESDGVDALAEETLKVIGDFLVEHSPKKQ